MNAIQTLPARSSGPQAVFTICLLLASFLVVSPPAFAQDPTQITLTGVVVSYNKNALVARGEGGRYLLFVFDKHSVRPETLAVGTGVRVVSAQTDDPEVRLALVVTALEPSASTPGTTIQAQSDVVPESIRATESAIARDARKFHFGFQDGIALDPELMDFGIHAKFGPFFSKRASLRPGVDFAFGEITKLFALNLDAIFNLAPNPGAKQSVYFGLGPQFNFAHQSASNNEGVDFSDFHYSNALNLIVGVKWRSGVFTELKTSIWASPAPVIRLMAGYSF